MWACHSRRKAAQGTHHKNIYPIKKNYNILKYYHQMTIADIIELENNRKSPDTFGRIHFIKEGNFYRAHDISA